MNAQYDPSHNQLVPDLISAIFSRRAVLWIAILVTALIGFEMFNFSTTQFALDDLLGEIHFAGMRWSTILALAFCGIDFAGIARLFTPDADGQHSREAWYLFAAWLLAATMNAILTWWGVSMALASHTVTSTYIVNPNILARGVPVFIALVVWVTRFLLISTLSTAAGRVSYPAAQHRPVRSQAVEVRQNQIPAPHPRTAVSSPLPRQRMPSSPPQSRPAAAQTASAPRPTLMVPPRATRFDQPQPQRAAEPVRQPAPAAMPKPAPPKPQPRPVVNRPALMPKPPQTPAPRPRPVEPPPPPEEPMLPEPEYIPDPFYAQPQSAYHSLSASPKAAPDQPKSLF